MNELMTMPVGEVLLPDGEYAEGLKDLRMELQPILANAKAITAIATAEEHLNAVAAGRLLQAASKSATEFFKPFKAKIDEVKKVVLADEKAAGDPLGAEKQRIGGLTLRWEQEQERIRQEEQRRLREEAKRAEEEARLAEAIALESEGLKEEAEQMLEAPAMPVPVIAQRAVAQKTAGSVTRTTWRGKVGNFHMLVKAVANGVAPIETLLPNQSFIDKQANAFREGLNYPGISVEKEVKAHFRG